MKENISILEGSQKNLSNMIEVPVLDEVVETAVALEHAYATGRRKEAVAKLWISVDKSEKFDIKKMKDQFNSYFKNEALAFIIVQGMILLNETQNFAFNFKLKFKLIGGGKSCQAQALRLAFSKSLALLFPDIRPILRSNGYLTTDARRKEREHPGFRTSRKPQQYSRR